MCRRSSRIYSIWRLKHNRRRSLLSELCAGNAIRYICDSLENVKTHSSKWIFPIKAQLKCEWDGLLWIHNFNSNPIYLPAENTNGILLLSRTFQRAWKLKCWVDRNSSQIKLWWFFCSLFHSMEFWVDRLETAALPLLLLLLLALTT